MTSSSTDQPVRGPVGMPAHLWELAKSDVRLSVPNRVRNAVANGLNAPEGVRRIAARVAVTGAAMGVPAAMLGLGGFLDAADQPVALAGGETPLDGLDGAPAVPGSYDGGGQGGGGFGGGYGGGNGGPGGGHGGGALGGDLPSEGFAHATTQSDGGDVAAGLGSTWHVQDPTTPGGDWLTVQMFQDVTVTETADGMFVVDAWQFIVISDDDGNEYVFKEHYQVIVPDPPGQETDLIIHERGFVHVIERPDGTFGVETDFGIDVSTVADGDGRDEVTIGQDQHVRYTDTDGKTDDQVTVDLSEKATSTSDDEGDKATTTIDQDQVFDDGRTPSTPFEGGKKQSDGDEDDRPDTTNGKKNDSDDDEDDGKDPKGSKDDGDGKDGRDGRDPHDDDPGTGPHGGHGGVDPSSPFGEEPADRGTGSAPGTGSPSAPAGTGTAPAASAPAASGAGAATTARSLDSAPLASAAVAAPAASVLAGEGPTALTGLDAPAGPELDAPPAGTEQSAPQTAGPEHAAGSPTPDQQHPDAPTAPEGTAPEPFGGSAPSTGPAPFEPPDTGTAPEPTSDATAGKNSSSTPDDRGGEGDNTPAAGHESQNDPTGADSQEPAQAEHAAANHDGGPDAAEHGTDGADHALVS